MSLSPAESVPKGSTPHPDAAPGHSHGDISALLFELTRAIRARRCLPADDVRCREAIARAHGACCGSAERHGPLTLIVEDDGFRVAATGERFGREPAPSLAMRCREQSVTSLAFEPGAALDAFVRVVDALAMGPHGTNASSDARSRAGEEFSDMESTQNGLPAQSTVPRPEAAAEGATTADRDRTLDTLPCHPHAAHTMPDVSTEDTEPTPYSAAAPAATESETETASDQPQTSHSGPDDLCVEDDGFEVLERLLVQSANPAASDEARAAARNELLARAATAPLDVLVSRACTPDASTSIRASQILLQLGAPVVPELLDRIVAEKDEHRRGALCGVLIVMGETATPVLVEAMGRPDGARARNAVWLAGEIQNAAAVPALARAVDSSDAQLQREAARALAKLGHQSAIAALDALLESGDPERVSLAAWCLAASPGAAALSLLCERLRTATTQANFALAREIVHALARRGSTDVVPDLAVLFSRRSLLHRRPLRELKLAAVRALSKIPGQSAERALREAAEGRDAHVREAALSVLARRTPGCPAAA